LPDSGELTSGFVRGLGAKGQVVHLGVLSDRMRAKECRRLAVRRRAGAAAAADAASATRRRDEDHTRAGKLKEVLGERLEGLAGDGS
jgi:hypothetical protein